MAEAVDSADDDDFMEANDDYYGDDDFAGFEQQISVESESARDPEAFSYECHNSDNCLKMLRDISQEIAEELKIPVDIAQILLQNCKWKLDSVRQRFAEDAQKLLVESHAQPDPSSLSAAVALAGASVGECGICFLSLESDAELAKLQVTCNHRFCKPCWREHFVARLSSVPTMPLECLSCAAYVGDSFARCVLADTPKYLSMYKQYALARVVLGSSDLAQCPGPGCDYVVKVMERAAKRVVCKCHAQFCFLCQDDYHAPLPCSLMKEWQKRCTSDSQSTKYIISHTKQCPKCRVSIEKSGGCNHMVCVRCAHNFCWVCRGDWSKHGTEYYHCSRYKPDVMKEKERTEEMEAMARYFFYYERFFNHRQSIMLEERTRNRIKELIRQRCEGEGATGTWIDYQYLMDAFDILLKSRYIMQYTYPYAFFMSPDAPARTLLEHQQSQLEREIEALSFLIEQATLSNKAEIQLHCMHVKQWRISLLKDIGNTNIPIVAGEQP